MSSDDTEKVNQIVDSTWKVIESERAGKIEKKTAKGPPDFKKKLEDMKPKPVLQKPTNFWTTVKIFISSTFRDMNAEREYIIKKAMPVLADWAEKRGIGIVECDLRWGVPKNSTAVDTILTCLGELDSIAEATENQPLFLGMLGERYGWIPNVADIPEDIIEKYKWIENVSITHMEFLQGAIRNNNRNALICMRTPTFSKNLTTKQEELYVDKGALEQKQLDALKKHVGKFLPDPLDQTHIYDAKLKDDGNVDFSAVFADKIVKFFQEAITRLYPDRTEFDPPDEIAQETYTQFSFCDRKCSTTFGMEDWVDELSNLMTTRLNNNKSDQISTKSFVSGESIIDKVSEDELKAQERYWPAAAKPEQSGWTSRPICLTSDPGLGKTSVICATVKHFLEKKSNDFFTFFHFAGMTVSENSVSLYFLIKRLQMFMIHVLDIKKELPEVLKPSNLSTAIKKLNSFFEQLQEQKNKKVLLFFDCLESLADVVASSEVYWNSFFPVRFPANCVVFISASVRPQASWIHYYLCLSDAVSIKMPDAPIKLRKIMATTFFEGYTKKLDSEQLEAITNNDGAHVPLWLNLACEELRVFGNFREVTTKIKEFDTSLDGILTQILNRLIEEAPDLPVAKFLSFLAITPRPLAEQEYPRLLRSEDTNVDLAPMDMARLRLALKAYILFATGKRVIVLPFHGALITAAQSVCVPTLKDKMATKKALAFHMINHNNTNIKYNWSFSISELLWESDCRKTLLEFLQYDKICRHSAYRHEFLNKFRCESYIQKNSSSMKIPFNCCFSCSIKVDMKLNGKVTDHCWICKQRLHEIKQKSNQATACPNHADCPLQGGAYICKVCNMNLGQHNGKWTPLLLCEWCSTSGKCAYVSVEQSVKRQPYYATSDDI